MTREIKFRGKRLDNGEWVCGCLYYSLNPHKVENEIWYAVIQEPLNNIGGSWKVDPETIGQYTGLKDKHGKEIYEGDNLIADNGRIYNLVWFDTSFMIQSKSFTKGEKRIEKTNDDKSIWLFECSKFSNLSKLEVTGSIHDPKPITK